MKTVRKFLLRSGSHSRGWGLGIWGSGFREVWCWLKEVGRFEQEIDCRPSIVVLAENLNSNCSSCVVVLQACLESFEDELEFIWRVLV